MTLIYRGNECVLLDHAKFINQFYKNVSGGKADCGCAYELLRNLYSIQNNKKTGNRKRSHNADGFLNEVSSYAQA